MSYTAPTPVASGTTFAQFQAGGASGHLEKLIAAQGATSAPSSAPTLAASGSGNTLAAATYYVVITESNGFGETTQSPASASQVVSSGQQLTVAFPSLQPGNLSRNVYLGTVSAGPFTLYATGITTATYNCTVVAPTNSYAVNAPTINTTGLIYTDANGNTNNKTLELIRSAKDGNFQDLYRFLRQTIEEFNSGQPTSWQGKMTKLRQAHAAIAILDKLCSEMGMLMDANAGTLYLAPVGPGLQRQYRGWP